MKYPHELQFKRIVFLAMHEAVRTICDVFGSVPNSLSSPKMHSLGDVGKKRDLKLVDDVACLRCVCSNAVS